MRVTEVPITREGCRVERTYPDEERTLARYLMMREHIQLPNGRKRAIPPLDQEGK